MKIYLSRHGQTVWNRDNLLQGSKNSPLTQNGIDAAKALSKKLENKTFTTIYVSPLLRAKETAEIVFPHQKFVYDARIREMSFGNIEGRFKNTLSEEETNELMTMWHRPIEFKGFQDGETFEDVIIRVNSFLNEIIDTKSNDEIFIMAHGMIVSIILGCLFRIPLTEWTDFKSSIVDGCSLTIIDLKDDQIKLQVHNQ